MTLEQLEQIVDENEIPDISRRFELRTIVAKFPYFQAGIFVYLKCLYVAEDNMFRQELQRLSVFVNNKRSLFYYILEKEYKSFFQKKGKEKEIDKDRTNILLNAFFETVDDSVIDAQLDTLMPKVENQITDYFAYINSQEQVEESQPSTPLKCQHIIDRFIDNADQHAKIQFDPDKDTDAEHKPKVLDENATDELQDDLFFTETLASIYIKQHKYERAYEIIKRLSLNYPEKNIYFANQISFLKKLIINSNVKNKREI